jgi:aminopeptidase
VPPDPRFEALADLAVQGVNVQPGQVVAVGAELEQEELARAVAVAAYKRGAHFVDVLYFDPWVKRARIEHADPSTLDFVPDWLGSRLLTLGKRGDARIALAGITAPEVFDGLDPARLGRDRMPYLKETGRVIDEGNTNWAIVPCPHPAWAELVYPELTADGAYEQLWEHIWHIMRLDEPDPAAAWDERSESLKRTADALTKHHFGALELEGPGTSLRVGLFPTSTWRGGDHTSKKGVRFFANLPTEEVFTTPDPEQTEGYVTSTKPLVFKDGTIVRGLRVRFEGGRAVEIDADENAAAIQMLAKSDEGASRLGEVALVDRHGRIGPLGTVFYTTLLDENAESHIALGFGYADALGGKEDLAKINDSVIHVDFMIGSPEFEVVGVTSDGERVPVLRGGDWQI